jgi:hypothetical protein
MRILEQRRAAQVPRLVARAAGPTAARLDDEAAVQAEWATTPV